MTPLPAQTADDLLPFRESGKTAELVRGVLVVREPPATSHGGRAARLVIRIGNFVDEHGLGEVFAQDTGFRIQRDPDTVRAPDVAFVARDADLDGEDVLPGFRCPLREVLATAR